MRGRIAGKKILLTEMKSLDAEGMILAGQRTAMQMKGPTAVAVSKTLLAEKKEGPKTDQNVAGMIQRGQKTAVLTTGPDVMSHLEEKSLLTSQAGAGMTQTKMGIPRGRGVALMRGLAVANMTRLPKTPLTVDVMTLMGTGEVGQMKRTPTRSKGCQKPHQDVSNGTLLTRGSLRVARRKSFRLDETGMTRGKVALTKRWTDQMREAVRSGRQNHLLEMSGGIVLVSLTIAKSPAVLTRSVQMTLKKGQTLYSGV